MITAPTTMTGTHWKIIATQTTRAPKVTPSVEIQAAADVPWPPWATWPSWSRGCPAAGRVRGWGRLRA